jgi:hypothetical protein
MIYCWTLSLYNKLQLGEPKTIIIVLMFQIHVHHSDLTSFYEEVPKKVLPVEYGGDPGSVSEIWGMFLGNFIS